MRALLGSLRLRLVWWFIVAMTIASIGSAVVVRQVLLQRLDARIDADLRQEVSEVTRLAAGNDPETGEPFGPDVERIFEVFLSRNIPAPDEVLHTYLAGRLLAASAGEAAGTVSQDPVVRSAWAGTASVERGFLETSGGRVDYLSVPFEVDGVTRGSFAVGILRDLRAADTNAAVVAVVAVALIVGALGSILAVRLADRILRPVREVTQTAVTITGRDLSERIPVRGDDEIARLAQTFNEMVARLEAAFEMQRRFIDDAGHELRTPITIIQGHLDLLSDDPDERERTYALIHDELDRVRRMIGDLLTLAKAQDPEFLRPRAVDVGELTRSIFEKARGLGDRQWRLDDVATVHAGLDEQRITQAVLQLAENAVRHTGEGDVVGVGSAVSDGRLRFWVRDAGPGVPPAERERIFERFYHGRTPRGRGGSGLGLSIVKAIAAAHGGHASVREADGGGAYFSLDLPLATRGEPS